MLRQILGSKRLILGSRDGIGDIFGVILWDLGVLGGFFGFFFMVFWGVLGLRLSCVGGCGDRWGSLGSLGSWIVLVSLGAIWGAETNFGVKKMRFGVRVMFYGGDFRVFWGVWGLQLSCVGGSVDRWGSLGSLGSWSVLGC